MLKDVAGGVLALMTVTIGAAPAAVTVPFSWTPGQIEVPVVVNGTAATFLLDTGAEYSVVSTRLARAIDLSVAARGGRGFADDVTLRIGALDLPRQRVMVMPFDTYAQRGRQIDGLIGYDVFAAFVVRIDFQQKALTLWTPAAFEPPAAAAAVPLTFAGRLPVVSAVLTLTSGAALDARLMVATGASQAVMLRYPFATRHELIAKDARESSAPSLADGTRRLVDVPVDQVALGHWTFDRPLVRAFADPVGSAGPTETDGLIGNTLLSRFTLYVDYPRSRLLLEPRAHGVSGRPSASSRPPARGGTVPPSRPGVR